MKLKHLRNKKEIQEGINTLTSIFIDEYPYYSEWIKKKKEEFDTFEKKVLSLIEKILL